MKHQNWLGAAGALAMVFSAASAHAQKAGEEIGYAQTTFKNAAKTLKLIDSPRDFDILNLSFIEPTTQLGSTLTLRAVEGGVYGSEQELIDDIKAVQARGQKVYGSLGGAEGVINVDNSQKVGNCVTSLNGLIDKYNLDGLDIDLEGGSLSLDPGDTDFRNPRTARVTGVIQCIRGVLSAQPRGFGLSMAPETFLVQVGMEVYAGAAGAALPVIFAFRNEMTKLQVQYYNTGSVSALDGVAYQPATVDHFTSLIDMLLVGFPVAGGGMFPALRPEQVAIGLPASSAAAGRGAVPASVVDAALRQIATGRTASGARYQSRAGAVTNFGGVMIFSVNHGVTTAPDFSGAVRQSLNQLFGGSRVSAGLLPVLRD
jgi:chitinase